MRILHLIGGLAPGQGGPHKSTPELCRALARLGHEVTIYTTNVDGPGLLDVPTDRPIYSDGVRIFYYPVGPLRRWTFSRPLGKALRDNVRQFDIVHIHSLYCFHTLAAAHYCRKHDVPYLIRPHGTLDPFMRQKSRYKKAVYNFLIEKRNLNGCAAMHYTTTEEMALAHKPMRLRPPGIVAPLGLYPDDYANLPTKGSFRAAFPRIEDRQVLLFLGRIDFKKGLDILARAYGMICQERRDMALVIAGPDNEGYGRQVRKWLAHERVLDRVVFTGMLTGELKLAALRDADVFVLPSYGENFGLAVLEAMATALPVVISNRVNIWREIEAARAGVVVNCDAAEVASEVLALMNAPEERRELGANGKRLVEEQFTWERAAAELSAHYERILNRARSPRIKGNVQIPF